MWISLKNVFNKAVKITSFISSQPLNAWLFKYTSLLLDSDLWWFSQRKAIVQLLESQAELSAFFMEHYVSLKVSWTDKLWWFRLGHLADIFSKINIMSLTLQGNNWQYLFDKDKIWVFKPKTEFWEIYICLYELDNFSIQKHFSSEIKKCYYLTIYNKMFQHLEICIIQ